MSKLFYPNKKQKPYKERVERTSLTDQMAGLLSPLVYHLNKGKEIKPNSHEHKSMKEFLVKINGIS